VTREEGFFRCSGGIEGGFEANPTALADTHPDGCTLWVGLALPGDPHFDPAKNAGLKWGRKNWEKA